MPRGGHNKLNQQTFLERSRDLYKNKDGSPLYDYSLSVYVSNQKKVIIICPKEGHGTFEKSPAKHFDGQGCPDCSTAVRAEKRRTPLQDFIDAANAKHGIGRYDYSEVRYLNNRTDVKIICVGKGHKPFWQTPGSHLAGNGCPLCGFENTAGQNRLTREEFISRAIGIHGNLYSYDELEYINNKTKVRIICPIHGGFWQSPGDHLSGNGCATCGRIRTTMAQTMSLDEFIRRARAKHGEYGYSAAKYVNMHTRIIILCSIHGSFEQTPVDHLSGHKCPSCRATGFSRLSMEWLQYKSDSMKVPISHALNGGEFRIPGTKYSADGYIESTNTVLEFHGDYWHGNPRIYNPEEMNTRSGMTFGELYKRTLEKRDKILSLGYNYEEIWESDWLDQRGAALAAFPPYDPDTTPMVAIEDEDNEGRSLVQETIMKYLATTRK